MSEPLSLDRNIERLAGLWPSAGLTHDWIDLFRKTFANVNQHWLAEAMENVKRSKASHVPELKWFIEAFHEIRRGHSASTGRPMTISEKERLERERMEAERPAIEAERRHIRRKMAELHPESLERIRHTFSQMSPLRSLASAIAGDVSAWPDFSLGMAHAIAVRDGLMTEPVATFAAGVNHEGDDR